MGAAIFFSQHQKYRVVCLFFRIDMALHISKIEITNDIQGDDYMVVTIYIACVLISVMYTWYLMTQLRFKKEFAASGGSHEQLKETRISIGLCLQQ